MPFRYFEDFAEGQSVDLGTFTFTADEIVDFAQTYDPQPMHVDAEAGRQSIYGGLIASGWQTATRYMRLLVDTVIRDSASLGSPGMDSLRWPKPVRPGDLLKARFTIVEARLSNSRPDWGIVRSRGEVVNQKEELVMQVEAVNFFARRPPG
jgi:acyl dehydratase